MYVIYIFHCPPATFSVFVELFEAVYTSGMEIILIIISKIN